MQDEGDATGAARRRSARGLALVLALAGSASIHAAAPGAPVALSQTERAAIMRAAGFTRPGTDNRWRFDEDGCNDVWAEIDRVADINGDGRPDAIVTGDNDHCFGMNQRRVAILTRGPKGWTSVTSFRERFAVFGFHPRPGRAWPDIEIFDGMAGDTRPDGSIAARACTRFLRWDGRAYIDGGTSQNGRICELSMAARRAPGSRLPSRGRVDFPPIEAGYYAIGTSCAEAMADGGDRLAYLDATRFISFDGGLRVTGFERLGDDRYRIGARSVEESGRRSGTDLVIRVGGRTHFTDADLGERYTHCPTAQVPNAIRMEWGDLARR